MGDWNAEQWMTLGLFGGDDEDKQEPAAAPVTPQETGKVETVESVEAQAAQRRLARLSKYFTSPTGVLDSPTGGTGVF